jgi:hypothetical protein
VLAPFVCLSGTTATLFLFSPWLCVDLSLVPSKLRSLLGIRVAPVRESQLALNISPRLGWTVFTDTPHAAQPSQPLEDSLLALRRPQTPAIKLQQGRGTRETVSGPLIRKPRP